MNIDLSEVEYPAITICSEQTTKYAFAERLGNYLDPDESHPDLLPKLQNKFLEKTLENLDDDDYPYKYQYARQCKNKFSRKDKCCEVSAINISLKTQAQNLKYFLNWSSVILNLCITKSLLFNLKLE